MKSFASCPACGSDRTAAILYEFPKDDPRLLEDLKSGRALWVRRPRTGSDPGRRCLKCGFEWDHPRGVPA